MRKTQYTKTDILDRCAVVSESTPSPLLLFLVKGNQWFGLDGDGCVISARIACGEPTDIEYLDDVCSELDALLLSEFGEKYRFSKPYHPFDSDLREAIDSDKAYNFLPDGDWLHGGCALLAQSLKIVFNCGELVSFGRKTEVGVVDHVALRLSTKSGDVLIDGDGVHTETEMLRKMRLEFRIENVFSGKADMSALRYVGVISDRDDVPGFTKFLRARLGDLDAGCVDLAFREQ